MKTIALSALVALTVLTASTTAFADTDRAEAQAQKSAKITYEKAKSLAVSSVGGGNVVDIDFDLEPKGAHYDVEVIHNNTKYDVKIDANTGAVLQKRIDD